MKKETEDNENLKKLRTCFLCTYPPRDCGIASFTYDLSSAMDKKFNPKLRSIVIAMNEDEEEREYPEKVMMQMSKEDMLHYIESAKRINDSDNIKMVNLQHEFGLFGGEYGSYIIPFLEMIKKPVVVTFHTVLPKPDEARKKIVKAIADRVSAIVVIANKAIEILTKDYGIDKEKIFLVHHGIPNVPYESQTKFKKQLGLENKIVLSTHGLLSRGKGIEYAIRSLPPLIEKYPNLVLIIIGETHPAADYHNGKGYRKDLKRLIKKFGLQEHVKFVNRYVSLQELIEYIQASDAYVFTNLEKPQISSGTLCRALGCGRAIVATPIVYAEELLADNRGLLVKFKDPQSFTNAIDQILSDDNLKNSLEKKAYFYTRQMIWENVAIRYLQIFNKVVTLRKEITDKLPKIKLDHFRRLTDNIGMIQFANHSKPDIQSGYTLDDNARALITMMIHYSVFKSQDTIDLTKTYLNFIDKAQQDNGWFKNNFNNIEESVNPFSEDAFGRTIWALGFTINKTRNHDILTQALRIFNHSFQNIDKINSPRSVAFTLMGLHNYYKTYPSRDTFIQIKSLANKLVKLFEREATKDWQWFEPYLTYANAKIPQSLFLAYSSTGDSRYLEIAKKSLKFLSDQMIIDGKLAPIGQRGWYEKDKERALYDQQPIDSAAIVQCFLSAYYITGNSEYYDKALLSFNWFLGNNHLNQMVYDESTGGCFDGLGRESLNFNQGAESTISYLTARLYLEEFKKIKRKKEKNQKMLL